MALIDIKYGVRICLDFLLLLIVAVPILIFYLLGKPFERGFYCSDDSIRYPYKDSTVTTLALYLVGTLLPLFFILGLEWQRCRSSEVGKRVHVCGRPLHSYFWSLYNNVGCFLFGCAVSQLLTDVAKYSIGRLRPHFLSICNPDWSTITCVDPVSGGYNYVLPDCSPKDEDRLKEARLSFPSGHASFSAFTMIYLVLYLQARMRLRVRLVRPFVQFACLLMAFYTSLSRVSDYKHHWSDVLFGALLGTVVAVLVWWWLGSQLRSRGDLTSGRSLHWVPLEELSPGASRSYRPQNNFQHESNLEASGVASASAPQTSEHLTIDERLTAHRQQHLHKILHREKYANTQPPCQYEPAAPYVRSAPVVNILNDRHDSREPTNISDASLSSHVSASDWNVVRSNNASFYDNVPVCVSPVESFVGTAAGCQIHGDGTTDSGTRSKNADSASAPLGRPINNTAPVRVVFKETSTAERARTVIVSPTDQVHSSSRDTGIQTRGPVFI
ncbi:phospholipid phosphatase homolog 1.2 homolog isoform X2 [Hyalella azteca]|uniref:Phospholipid phosphatase homolog 1.2 homolog isoform X2 n=1 Tax=Hyalella azteca TaxID=294128 RepID=A0A8B7P1H2_HYAAZ|nr:phospholipid phosphatase homolog 1.2 homolog isoform X2 [Hyalella azteca]